MRTYRINLKWKFAKTPTDAKSQAYISKQILRRINKNKTQQTKKEMYSLATILLIGSAAALTLEKNETVDMAQVNATHEG